MFPLLLIFGGLFFVASYANRSRSTPEPYRPDETADQIWKSFIDQHSKLPNGAVVAPGKALPPPSYAEARASLPDFLVKEFDDAMASSTGDKARVLLAKLGSGYPEASRLLVRKAATS